MWTINFPFIVTRLYVQRMEKRNSPERYIVVSFPNIWLTCVIYGYMRTVIPEEDEGDSRRLPLLLDLIDLADHHDTLFDCQRLKTQDILQ